MDNDEKRKLREAKALEIIKAIRRDPDPRAEKPFLLTSPKGQRGPLKHTELPGDSPDPPGYVYFVYCGGRIKIGYATDLASRMSGLGTSCPFPMTLLLTIRGSLEDEKRFHEHFEEDQVNREWFAVPLGGDLYQFLWSSLDDDGFELWLEAQLECRFVILAAAADVVSLTGGDTEGRALCAAEFPGTFEIDHPENGH